MPEVNRPLASPDACAEAGTRTRRVVSIGGGTGLSTLLRGLKRHVIPYGGYTLAPRPEAASQSAQSLAEICDLAAIVTVTDDGGSSGRLRKDFNMLPPGDLRNCMVALSEDERLISQLFRHRFRTGGVLEGHNFGNLFVAALVEMTGDFAHAVRLAADILASRGHIYPVTTANVALAARMSDGAIVHGETSITASKLVIEELMLEPPNVEPLPEALDAIRLANIITLGPGSLFTSIITNLLVTGIADELAKSKATRVYVANLMTQANESLHLTASQHIERIYDYCREPIFDYALINTAPVPEAAQARYAAEGAEVIAPDIEKIEAMGIRCITGNFAAVGDVVRHAPDSVADAIMALPLR